MNKIDLQAFIGIRQNPIFIIYYKKGTKASYIQNLVKNIQFKLLVRK